MNLDPKLSELIHDRIDAENAMTKIFLAFRHKYPSLAFTVNCSASPGAHMEPVVRITSSF
jgi:hypothetical protein